MIIELNNKSRATGKLDTNVSLSKVGKKQQLQSELNLDKLGLTPLISSDNLGRKQRKHFN